MELKTSSARTDIDLAIVGSGFGGSILAMIARRLGYRVMLLERGRHPRFAIGESASPLAGVLIEQLADRYDLPRLRPLSAEAFLSLGQILRQQGDAAGSAAALAEADRLNKLKAADQAATFAVSAGRKKMDAVELPGAIAQFREAVRLSPEHAQAQYQLGLALRPLSREERQARHAGVHAHAQMPSRREPRRRQRRHDDGRRRARLDLGERLADHQVRRQYLEPRGLTAQQHARELEHERIEGVSPREADKQHVLLRHALVLLILDGDRRQPPRVLHAKRVDALHGLAPPELQSFHLVELGIPLGEGPPRRLLACRIVEGVVGLVDDFHGSIIKASGIRHQALA